MEVILNKLVEVKELVGWMIWFDNILLLFGLLIIMLVVMFLFLKGIV